MRIDHWIKQLFVLPGFVCILFLANYSFNYSLFIKLIIGLFATSLIASANYVINEYLDAEFDKYHPTKKKRPLVEDNVKGSIIWLLWFILSIIGLSICYFTIVSAFFFS